MCVFYWQCLMLWNCSNGLPMYSDRWCLLWECLAVRDMDTQGSAARSLPTGKPTDVTTQVVIRHITIRPTWLPTKCTNTAERGNPGEACSSLLHAPDIEAVPRNSLLRIWAGFLRIWLVLCREAIRPRNRAIHHLKHKVAKLCHH